MVVMVVVMMVVMFVVIMVVMVVGMMVIIVVVMLVVMVVVMMVVMVVAMMVDMVVVMMVVMVVVLMFILVLVMRLYTSDRQARVTVCCERASPQVFLNFLRKARKPAVSFMENLQTLCITVNRGYKRVVSSSPSKYQHRRGDCALLRPHSVCA